MRDKTPILVTSLPRSGSTWCMKVLGACGGVRALMEPDHLDDWGIGENGMHPYIAADSSSPEYERMYRRCFSGHSRRPFALSRGYLEHLKREASSYLVPDRRVIVKSVYSLANTEWIFREFRPQVVLLLRNPYSICHSIHRKWPDARLKLLLDQPGLMKGVLAPYRDVLAEARTPYETLASRVGAYYRIVLEAAARNPEWVVVKHEDLCADPEGAYRSLYGRINMQWAEGVQGYLSNTNRPKTSDAVQHVNRLSSAEVDKWRMLLTSDEIEEIRRFYEPFGLEHYCGIAV